MWTTPRDWTTGELVTSTHLNTHLRDNLNYLKSNPVIAEGSEASAQTTSNAQDVLVGALGPTTIPSDIGACFVELWSHVGMGMTSFPTTGHNYHGCYVTDGTTTVIDSRQIDYASVPKPYYARSADMSWAGLSKTVLVYLDGYNFVGGAVGYIGPFTIRIVRSY